MMLDLLEVINTSVMEYLKNVDLDHDNIRTLYFNEMIRLLKLQSELTEERKTIKFYEYEHILNIIQNDFGVNYMTPDFYEYLYLFLNSLEALYKKYIDQEISFIINRDYVEVCMTSNLDHFNNFCE
jgi:hypothetical protein